MEAASALREAPQPLQAARLGASSFPEAVWQAMLSTHRGQSTPSSADRGRAQLWLPGVRFLLPHNPPGTFLPTAQEKTCPQEATGPAPARRSCQPHIPSWGFACCGPSAPAAGQRAPTAAALPSQRPRKGLFSFRKHQVPFLPSHHGRATGLEKLCLQKRAISSHKYSGTEPSGTTWMANTVV